MGLCDIVLATVAQAGVIISSVGFLGQSLPGGRPGQQSLFAFRPVLFPHLAPVSGLEAGGLPVPMV